MSDEPSYPKEAAVGTGPASDAVKRAASSKTVDPTRKKNYVKAGVAVGIGSAAIVAALMYANRARRDR